MIWMEKYSIMMADSISITNNIYKMKKIIYNSGRIQK